MAKSGSRGDRRVGRNTEVPVGRSLLTEQLDENHAARLKNMRGSRAENRLFLPVIVELHIQPSRHLEKE